MAGRGTTRNSKRGSRTPDGEAQELTEKILGYLEREVDRLVATEGNHKQAIEILTALTKLAPKAEQRLRAARGPAQQEKYRFAPDVEEEEVGPGPQP